MLLQRKIEESANRFGGMKILGIFKRWWKQKSYWDELGKECEKVCVEE